MEKILKGKTKLYTDPTRYFQADADHRIYLVIDLKSFYASVECVARGLDPMKAKLVVADPERSKGTICLAVSPELKRLGVRNRCRIYEIPEQLDYITAVPRMQYYLDCSAEIYAIYLRYIAKEDIHVYSIDEAFLDVTDYLELYQMTAKELGLEIMQAIMDTTGIPATCGIGTNLYLAKIALDILAKHADDFIGILTEETYRELLWDHQPLTDFWMVAGGISRRLAHYGIHTMRDIARIAMVNEDLLYRLFGIDAEILIDHAFGIENVRMTDIKGYQPRAHSLCSGQVLMRDYTYAETGVVIREMVDQICLDMMEKNIVTASMTLVIGYSHHWDGVAGKNGSYDSGTVRTSTATASGDIWGGKVTRLYEQIVNRAAPIRRLSLTCNRLKKADNSFGQCSFLDEQGRLSPNIEEPMKRQKRQGNLQRMVLRLRRQYGKNAVLKGINLDKAGTQRERNCQIGGHKSGMERVWKTG